MQITPKLFMGLAVAAGLSLAAAGVIFAMNNDWSVDEVTGEALFPRLADKANTVVAVELKHGAKTITLAREEDGWVAREFGDYPVQPEQVRALIVKLAQAELIEAKTRNPDKYDLLSLGDPSAKNSEARLIRLLDGSGTAIAEVVLGKKRWDAFGGGRSGHYVRKPGDPQTWLATLDADAKADIKRWVDVKVFAIESAQIRALTLEQAGEMPLTFRKGDGEDAKFELAEVPEGAKLKEGASADATVRGFANIELEDVRKLNMTPAGNDVRVARLQVGDGLTVTFRLREEKGRAWISLIAEGSGEAASKAEKINARTRGWEFKIPSWKPDSLFKTRSDFFETS